MKNNFCFLCTKEEKLCNGNRPCDKCLEGGNGGRCVGNEVIQNARVREYQENNFQKDNKGNLIEIIKTPLLPPTSTLLPNPTGNYPMFTIIEEDIPQHLELEEDLEMDQRKDDSSPQTNTKANDDPNKRRRGRPKGSKNKKTKTQKELEEKLHKQKKREERERLERIQQMQILQQIQQQQLQHQQQMQQQLNTNSMQNQQQHSNSINFSPHYQSPQISSPTNTNIHPMPPSFPFSSLDSNVFPTLMDTTDEIYDPKRRKGEKRVLAYVNNSPPNVNNQMMVTSSQNGMSTEILRLTQKQREMEEEILTLKLENIRLKKVAEQRNSPSSSPKINSSIDFQKSGFPPNFNQNDQQSLSSHYDKAMVVYDLSKKPPIVISATPTFYNLLNYPKEEVLNSPWHRFIDPDNVENTTKKLRSNTDTILTLLQNYIRKDGQAFYSNDVHTFFYGPNGDAILDVVILHPVRDYKLNSSESSQNLSFALEEDPSEPLFSPSIENSNVHKYSRSEPINIPSSSISSVPNNLSNLPGSNNVTNLNSSPIIGGSPSNIIFPNSNIIGSPSSVILSSNPNIIGPSFVNSSIKNNEFFPSGFSPTGSYSPSNGTLLNSSLGFNNNSNFSNLINNENNLNFFVNNNLNLQTNFHNNNNGNFNNIQIQNNLLNNKFNNYSFNNPAPLSINANPLSPKSLDHAIINNNVSSSSPNLLSTPNNQIEKDTSLFEEIPFSPFYKDDNTSDILNVAPLFGDDNDFVLESVDTLPLHK